MATAFKIATAVRNAMADAAVDRLNSGTVAIRTGAPPTNVSDASSGTLLGTCTLNATAFGNAGAAVAGRADSNAITSDTNADASGTAGHFRVYANGAGDTAADWQGTAGESGDTPDLVFDNKTIVAGGTIAISSIQFTQPIGP
jgi:hypothetical protein